MSWSDPVADMLTRIRNAHRSDLELVEMPHSRLKEEIARILKREGYVEDFSTEGVVRKSLRVYLRYTQEREPAIRGVKRQSKPGNRLYSSADKMPRVLSGLGISIVSTSAGVMTDKEARQKHLGGEILCSVW